MFGWPSAQFVYLTGSPSGVWIPPEEPTSISQNFYSVLFTVPLGKMKRSRFLPFTIKPSHTDSVREPLISRCRMTSCSMTMLSRLLLMTPRIALPSTRHSIDAVLCDCRAVARTRKQWFNPTSQPFEHVPGVDGGGTGGAPVDIRIFITLSLITRVLINQFLR